MLLRKIVLGQLFHNRLSVRNCSLKKKKKDDWAEEEAQ